MKCPSISTPASLLQSQTSLPAVTEGYKANKRCQLTWSWSISPPQNYEGPALQAQSSQTRTIKRGNRFLRNKTLYQNQEQLQLDLPCRMWMKMVACWWLLKWGNRENKTERVELRKEKQLSDSKLVLSSHSSCVAPRARKEKWLGNLRLGKCVRTWAQIMIEKPGTTIIRILSLAFDYRLN